MPELSPHAPDNPEFARVIELRQLRDLDAFDFDIAPTPGEAEVRLYFVPPSGKTPTVAARAPVTVTGG